MAEQAEAQQQHGLRFSEAGEREFQELIKRYPVFPPNKRDKHDQEIEEDQRMAALLPVLLLAQSEFGWVSVEVMDYIAERLNLHPAKVLSTATFYTMVNKQPIGKCHVQVCTTLTCALRGGYELLEYLEHRFGIRVGETSRDGRWTLTEAECLASCGTAPMFQATYSDGEIEYHEDLQMDAAEQVEESLSGGHKVMVPERVKGVVDGIEARMESLKFPREMHD